MRSATSTSATLERCSGSRSGGSATAGGPRTRCRRRSPRSGARPAATSPSAARSRRGSTPSRGTRSPTADARAQRDAGRAARRPPSDEDGPAERAEQSWVACRVHRAMEGLPETRARRARARLLERPLAERDRGLPVDPARYREDANPQRPAPPRGGAGGEAGMSGPDFIDLVGDDGSQEELERSAARTTCCVAAGPAARALATRSPRRRRGRGAEARVCRAGGAAPRSCSPRESPRAAFGVGSWSAAAAPTSSPRAHVYRDAPAVRPGAARASVAVGDQRHGRQLAAARPGEPA